MKVEEKWIKKGLLITVVWRLTLSRNTFERGSNRIRYELLLV